jgi:hypothetical protein
MRNDNDKAGRPQASKKKPVEEKGRGGSSQEFPGFKEGGRGDSRDFFCAFTYFELLQIQNILLSAEWFRIYPSPAWTQR